MSQTFVSGVKPTGIPHLGNYFGAMRQLVDLQKTHTGFVFIANYHALTTLHDKEELKKSTIDIAASYLAVGLDPQKTTLFLQSDVPEVTELGWIFNCLVTVPYLMRGHAYKDSVMANMEVNAGTLNYPVLMAADILMYNANIVPVGADQKQHIEITRDIAIKFNNTFGNTFTVPEPYILESVKTVLGTDGRKMSKSYGNTISIFGTEEETRAAVMSIPTDSKGIDEPKDTENVLFEYHRLVSTPEELEDIEKKYREGGIGYKESKELLVEKFERKFKDFREKKEYWLSNKDELRKILKEGGLRAKEIAGKTMSNVREKTGIKT